MMDRIIYVEPPKSGYVDVPLSDIDWDEVNKEQEETYDAELEDFMLRMEYEIDKGKNKEEAIKSVLKEDSGWDKIGLFIKNNK